MNLSKLALTFGVLAVALSLTACGGKKLLSKSLPDETQVIDGPGLALPPQFELRPPRESQDYEATLRAQKGIEAQNLITTGSSATTVSQQPASGPAPAEDNWLLNKTSAQTGVTANPNIRTELAAPVAEEETKAADKKKGLFQRWFGRSGSDE